MSARSQKKSTVSDEALGMVASWFRTLSEPSRLKILRALEDGEKSISEIVEASGLSQANVSRHAQSLVDAGIVGRRREGLAVICFITDLGITNLYDNVCNNVLKRLTHQVKGLGGV